MNNDTLKNDLKSTTYLTENTYSTSGKYTYRTVVLVDLSGTDQ